MARYLVVEVDNDPQAEALQEALAGKETMRVVGVFQKPIKFCECGPLSDHEQALQVTRGSKYGWRVHRKCRLPRKGPVSPRNLLEAKPAKELNYFLSLTPNYPLTVHNA